MKKLAMLVLAVAFLCYANPDYPASIKDKDGNIYKTVKIGDQVWMARNMRAKTPHSSCYDKVPSNCKKYGRLYSIEDAKKVCPQGWHLPSKKDFTTLQAMLNEDDENFDPNTKVFTSYMFGRYSSGEGEEYFSGINWDSYYWTSDEKWMDGYDFYVPVLWYINKERRTDFSIYIESYIEASVRCIMD